jgi:curved DNA-binding protein CbpA
MSDPFTILGLRRRPWLDGQAIRAAFQERARLSHPDAVEGNADAFAALNSAQSALANPASRLRLLAGETPLPAMPADVQLGFRVAEVMRRVGVLQEKDRAAVNVLARALLAGEAAQLRKDLDEVVAVLEAAKSTLDERLQALDARWPDVAADELAALAGEYVFLTRWKEQTREGELTLRIVFGKGGSGT